MARPLTSVDCTVAAVNMRIYERERARISSTSCYSAPAAARELREMQIQKENSPRGGIIKSARQGIKD